MSKKLEIVLSKGKETKRTWRYESEDGTEAVDTVYVQKMGLKELGNPDKIKLTIEPA